MYFLLALLLIVYPLGRGVWWLLVPQDSSWRVPYSLTLGLFFTTLIAYFRLPQIIVFLISLLCLIFLSHRLSRPHVQIRILPLMTVILSVVINSMLLFPFGQLSASGLSLPAAHFIDSTWHLSLIRALSRSVPPSNPLYSGTSLSNYHYLTDLQVAQFLPLSRVSPEVLFFRYFGPLYLLLASWLSYSVVKNISSSRQAGIYAVLLLMLTSNLYYLVPFFFPGASVSPGVMWIDFFSTKTVNYPLLFSLSVFLILLELVITYPKIRLLSGLVIGIISGFLFGFKSHTALVWLGALGLWSAWGLIRRRYHYLLPLIIATGCIFYLSRQIISHSGNALILSPFWFIKVMFESPDHLNTPDWELRRQTLLSQSAYLGIIKMYVIGVFWFLIINLGPQLIGLFYFFKHRSLLFVSFLLTSFISTMGFIYSTTAIVSIQFFYIFLVVCALMASIYLASIKSRSLSIAIFTIIFFLLVPGVKYTLYQYLFARTDYSPLTVQALQFLSQLPPGVVYTGSGFESGSIITAYTPHNVYVGDDIILSSLGINASSRRAQSLSLLSCASPTLGVDYYIAKASVVSPCPLVFSNPEVVIYALSNTPNNKLPQGNPL